MDSGLRQRILDALQAHADDYQSGLAPHERIQSLIHNVRALRQDPEPGGELPDPWPGMAFSVASGNRAAVQTCERHDGEYYVNHTGRGYMKWSADGIDEVRGQDGRILYRRAT